MTTETISGRRTGRGGNDDDDDGGGKDEDIALGNLF
jgi:hypothetical protein